jgi:hypothetical protein
MPATPPAEDRDTGLLSWLLDDDSNAQPPPEESAGSESDEDDVFQSAMRRVSTFLSPTKPVREPPPPAPEPSMWEAAFSPEKRSPSPPPVEPEPEPVSIWGSSFSSPSSDEPKAAQPQGERCAKTQLRQELKDAVEAGKVPAPPLLPPRHPTQPLSSVCFKPP